jgi:hypothetical protein
MVKIFLAESRSLLVVERRCEEGGRGREERVVVESLKFPSAKLYSSPKGLWVPWNSSRNSRDGEF